MTCLQSPDGKGERFGAAWLDDLAIPDGEVVERIIEFGFRRWLLPEADEEAIVLQNEVTGTPVADVLT